MFHKDKSPEELKQEVITLRKKIVGHLQEIQRLEVAISQSNNADKRRHMYGDMQSEYVRIHRLSAQAEDRVHWLHRHGV